MEQLLPADVAEILSESGVREALAQSLVGIYLRGSLALGDFDRETSDIDFLVVTESPVSPTEFDALAEMHAGIAASPNQHAHHLEGAYFDRETARAFRPDQRRNPTIGADWDFQWGEQRENWILELWILREHGVALVGPPARSLIDPISSSQLMDAVRAELGRWAVTAKEAPGWLLPRNYQAFAVGPCAARSLPYVSANCQRSLARCVGNWRRCRNGGVPGGEVADVPHRHRTRREIHRRCPFVRDVVGDRRTGVDTRRRHAQRRGLSRNS